MGVFLNLTNDSLEGAGLTCKEEGGCVGREGSYMLALYVQVVSKYKDRDHFGVSKFFVTGQPI